jgi:geranylgeranyl diphosphate synthase type II
MGEKTMEMMSRIQQALATQLQHAGSASAPPRLIAAMKHAVLPGGARIRPQLCIAVAQACGEDAPALTDAAAVAIELLHCASLVHDDMPCFDNAAFRRGQPTVHTVYGEPLALLTGDALIILAYQTLARAGSVQPMRLAGLLQTISDGVGAPDGIVAGQAWECESRVSLSQYQRAKTGALFVAATCAGAQAAGADPSGWRGLGECLGEAYQVADDIRDVLLQAEQLGKPAGQDAQHARPSAAHDLGLTHAITLFRRLMQDAIDAVPDCRARAAMCQIVLRESERLMPQSTCERAVREGRIASAPAPLRIAA